MKPPHTHIPYIKICTNNINCLLRDIPNLHHYSLIWKLREFENILFVYDLSHLCAGCV